MARQTNRETLLGHLKLLRTDEWHGTLFAPYLPEKVEDWLLVRKVSSEGARSDSVDRLDTLWMLTPKQLQIVKTETMGFDPTDRSGQAGPRAASQVAELVIVPVRSIRSLHVTLEATQPFVGSPQRQNVVGLIQVDHEVPLFGNPIRLPQLADAYQSDNIPDETRDTEEEPQRVHRFLGSVRELLP